MYVVRTVSGNNNNMTMSMTTAITDIDSFDKVLLLEENRKLRKEINKLRMEIEELRRASGG